MDLTDAQWAVLRPLIPTLRRRPDGRGHPWRDSRAGLDGILWTRKTGARWQDLPERYPPYQTGHRRCQPWVRAGGVERRLKAMAEEVRERGDVDLSEGFIEGTCVRANKGAAGWAPPSGARVARSWP